VMANYPPRACYTQPETTDVLQFMRQDVPMSSTASTTRPGSEIADASSQAGDASSAASFIAKQIDEPTPEPAEPRMSRIARRAHEIYEARGGRHGRAMEDWLTAERQIDDEIDRAGEAPTNADDVR